MTNRNNTLSQKEMAQTNSNLFLQSLTPIFGSVEELSDEITSAALDLAATPFADVSDTPCKERVLFILNEIRKALKASTATV